MIRALIFDFDGLILDTEIPRFQSWQDIYNSYGCHLDLEKWASNIGKGFDDFDPVANLEELLGHRLERKRLESIRRKNEIVLIDAQPALPGVENYLIDAQRLNLKVGLASCSSKDWVTRHLSRLDYLKYFDNIQTAEDVQFLKPDPEIYHKVLECLEVLPQQAIAFEDSPYGLQAARQAGIRCVFVPNPLIHQIPFDQADMHLNSLEDMSLEELIRTIQA